MRGQGKLLTIAIRYTEESLSTQEAIKINKLITGVPVLDEIGGGGLPKSFVQHHRGRPRKRQEDAGLPDRFCQCVRGVGL